MRRLASSVLGLLVTLGMAGMARAGEIQLTVVNVETPQGVKIWVPETIAAHVGDTVKLKLVNKIDTEHGFQIAAFGVEEVIAGQAAKDISFKASKKGIFPINCQLHPPHVAGQLIVLDD